MTAFSLREPRLTGRGLDPDMLAFVQALAKYDARKDYEAHLARLKKAADKKQ